MGPTPKKSIGPAGAATDRRALRTRAALKAALAANLLSHDSPPLTPTGLAAAAGVGRSTFYAHFSSADAVLEAALAEILEPFADALLGRAHRDSLKASLLHFWEHRRMARALLSGARGPMVAECLRKALEKSLWSGRGPWPGDAPTADRRTAAHVSGGALSLLDMWLSGRAAASADEMAALLAAASQGAARAMASRATRDGVNARA